MDIGVVLLAVAIVIAAFVISRRPSAERAGTQAADGLTEGISRGVESLAASVNQMRGEFESRLSAQERSAESIARLERVFAGSSSKGRAGENALAFALSDFPSDLLVRDMRIGGRVCEFALVMSDDKMLPIDSKWPGGDLLGQLAEASGAEAEGIRKQVEKAVIERIREVSTYIDPSVTVQMAVVAVPDGAFVCCRKAHAVAAESRVTLVPYSSALSVLMSIWNLYRAYGRDFDTERMMSCINELSAVLVEMGSVVESHLARALTQASNASDRLRSLLASARGAVGSLTIANDEARIETLAEVLQVGSHS